MFPGYNTNGFSYHSLHTAISIISELGYSGAAITPDVHHLNINPLNVYNRNAFNNFRLHLVDEFQLRCVIETGARFVLNPWRKHHPTLISKNPNDRTRRGDYVHSAIYLAKDLEADCVSFWSGAPDPGDKPEEPERLMDRLAKECYFLAYSAEKFNVRLAFEPEPGMFIDTMDKFAELHRRVNHPLFGLTLDVGHLVCMGEPIRETIVQWKDWLWNVHLDDMKADVHDHLMFGEGEVDFAEVFGALTEIDYQYGAYVELSRHAHDAVRTADRSMAFLDKFPGWSGGTAKRKPPKRWEYDVD